MDEDTIVLDQAMDIDSNVPPVPSAVGTSAATPRSPLRARRNLSNPTDKRVNHQVNSLKMRPGSRVQKPSSNARTDRRWRYIPEEHRQSMILQAMQKQRIQQAIANGSFQFRDFVPHEYGAPAAGQDQGELRQIKRLDETLVTEALFDPMPGMIFDPTAPWAFDNQGDIQDLVQALEAFQMHLARKGRAVPSGKAGSLLRGFARDVLAMVLLRPDKPGCKIGVDDFWTHVSLDYQRSKKVKWLTLRAMRALGAGMVETAPVWGKSRASFGTYVNVVLDALEVPGKHPKIDEVIAEASEEIPPFIVAQPSTLRSLMNHFEAGRARYLANLTADHDPRTPSSPVLRLKQAPGFGNVPRGDGQYDSSEDEDDGVRGGVLDGGAEDNGQVEEGVPSELSQWFLVKLDKWTASKSGEQQVSVDMDMLSALDLGDIKSE